MSTKKLIKALGLIIVVALLAAALPLQAKAEGQPGEVWVCPTGDCGHSGVSFNTIQAGINAVAEGGTVNVAAGTYNENVTVDKQLTIVGASADTVTVQAFNTSTPCFHITADGVSLSGFTVTGALNGYTDAILLDSADNCTISNNIATNNYWGITLSNAKNNTLTGNVANSNTAQGIGLVGADTTGNQIVGNTASNNASNGILLSPGVGGNNTISGNTVSANGKNGISISSSNNTVTNNTITGNATTNTQGAGIALFDPVSGNTIQFNTITGNTGFGGVGSTSSGTNDISKNWWGSATGPTNKDNPGGTGDVLWTNKAIALLTYSPWLANPPVHNVTQGTYHATIQAAIDAAANGDTIEVPAGTYVEDVVVTDKYFNLIGAVDTNGDPISVLEGSLFINNPTYGNPPEFTTLKNIYFERTDSHLLNLTDFNGGLIENCVFDGNNGFLDYQFNGINLVSSSNGNSNITVLDSTFKDGLYVGIGGKANGLTVTGSYFTNVKSGINLQGGGNLVVTGSTFLTKPVSDGDSYGIRFASSSGSTPNLKVTGSTFNIDDSLGFDPASGDYHAALYIRAGATGSLELDKNQILGDVVQLSTTSLDASPNWWGSALGPQFPIEGDVQIAKWCADEGCTTFLPDDNGDVPIIGTPFTQTGAIKLYVDGVNYYLPAGTTIQNDSPCFEVYADDIKIYTDYPAAAKCIPTNGSDGIWVADAVQNLRVVNLEFDGTDQETGSGIFFSGDAIGFQVIDNYFHDLDASGVVFTGTPSGSTMDIQGNMFQALGADAIVSPTMAVNAEYNSWGAYGGASLANVDSDPWTHVDLYVQSSGTPWANQVFTGGTITYTVYGNLQNVMGADFTLTYDPALLTLQTATAGAYFTIPALDPELGPSPLDTSVPGVIRFAGFQTTPVTGNNLPIFTATFTAAAPGTAALDLLDAGDAFAMFPGYGPSTNIYPAALLDGTVTVIAAPTLSSTDLAGPYLTDVLQEFHVTLNNPATGGSFSNVLVNFLVTGADPADVNSFEYWEVTTSSWQPMPLTSDGLGNLVGSFGPALGFPIVPGYNATSLFRVNFDTPGTYPVTMTLVDLTTDPDAVLASLAQDAVVYAQPVLSSTDLVGPYLAGIPQEFTLTMTNPAGGGNYTDPVLQFNLPTGAVLEYFDGTTWQTVTSPLDLAALAPDTVTELLFRATFPAGGSYLVDFTLVETATDPDWTLAALQQGVDVYANYSVTGTVSMQGRTYRGGVLVTLTGPALFAYGPYTATSLDVISSNVSFSNVAESTYTVTVTHARYLDVSSDLMKTKLVNATPTVLTSLELKGGDATDNQVVNLGDASAIGSQYGFSGTTNNGDVNFSGRVDVFDLVLVGGNFNLTAAAAYGGWIP